MSELDESLRGLRDDLRTGLTPPDLARVVDRARQRSVRRRMQVGAIAAVVAVSAAVPALRTMPEAPPAEPPEEPSVTYDVTFGDAEHGYAFGTDCQRPSGRCTFTLLTTADGGRTWQPRPLPDEGATRDDGELSVYGPDRLLFNGIEHAPDDVTAHLFSSEDGGRTWDPFTASAFDGPGAIAPGARLFTGCVAAGTDCDTVGWQDLDTTARVLTQPPLVRSAPGRVATAGGRYWVVGADPATGGWAISVTSDDGATWTTSPLDVPGTPTRRGPWSVVEHDGTLYATVVGAVRTSPVELLAVFRSTDGGRSWTRPFRAAGLVNVFGDAVATADGRLLVYSTTEGTLESRDGRTFEQAERQLIGPVTWTSGGYLAKGEDAYEISRDGVHWRRFELP